MTVMVMLPDGWQVVDLELANDLLARRHYLGPTRRAELVHGLILDCALVAVQVWAHPTSRRLPLSWLELTRWCLTPEAGKNAGSRQHKMALAVIRQTLPSVATLVSYSDPAAGHTGALYRACNWIWAPTWHRLRPPPSGNGKWTADTTESVKDRWVFHARRNDQERCRVLSIKDASLVAKIRAGALELPHELHPSSLGGAA